MQLNSIVGLGAAGVWLFATVGVSAVREARQGRGLTPLLAMGGIVLAAALALLWFQLSGNLGRAFSAFGSAQGAWAEAHAVSLRYYHYALLSHYPLLWAPFPLIALVSLARRPRAVSLWLLVFGTVFAVQTLAAWKAERYIFSAIPFFFMVVGVSVGPLIRWVWIEVARGLGRLAIGLRGLLQVRAGADAGGFEGDAPRWARLVTGSALVPVLLFAAWGNPASSYAARMVLGSDATWPFEVRYRGEADWAGVAEDLGGRAREVDIVITSTELKALYFLDRNDLILSVNYLGREPSGEMRAPFSRNWKSDTPMIARPETLEAIMACHRSGLVLVEENHWRQPWSVPPEVAAMLEERAERIELPPGRRVHAFGWEWTQVSPADAARCLDLRERTGVTSVPHHPVTES